MICEIRVLLRRTVIVWSPTAPVSSNVIAGEEARRQFSASSTVTQQDECSLEWVHAAVETEIIVADR